VAQTQSKLLESVEARWFFDPVDERVRSLEVRCEGLTPEPPREDRYIVTGRDDVGVKIRVTDDAPARMEMKLRIGALGPVALGSEVEGEIERWRKLSIEVDAAAVCAMDDAIVIRKIRRASTYAVDERGVRAVRAGDRHARACSVEWTRLERGGEVIAFTLAFEAAGASPADLLGTLQSRAVFVLRARPMPGIGAASSQGYAAWANALPRGSR
jgi:hypothetical protein